MRKLHYTLLAFLFITASALAKDFQYHISERYYNYYDSMRPSPHGDLHLFFQGPMIEQAIARNLNLNTKKCKPGINSGYIFSIKPQVFYNPTMTVLHGELKVKIFTSANILVDSKIIKIQHQGKINQIADPYINKLYDALINKLNNEVLGKLSKKTTSINGNFCTIIELNHPKKNLKKEYKKPIQA